MPALHFHLAKELKLPLRKLRQALPDEALQFVRQAVEDLLVHQEEVRLNQMAGLIVVTGRLLMFKAA